MTEETTIPSDKIVCACGCNEIMDRYDSRGGERRFIHGHNQRGRRNIALWNGGSYITKRGYRKVQQKNHPRADRDGYVFEHILVMEKKIGRYLERYEVVHHINGDRLDNRPENLDLMTRGGHSYHHHKDDRFAKVDMSNRKCCLCNGIPPLHKPRKPEYSPYYNWHVVDNERFCCPKCYMREKRRKNK
jgi:hypothetical protein